jgi:hypothetical protein
VSDSITEQARARLRRFLLDQRNGDGGWPYYAGKQTRLEPTTWAMLALQLDAHQTPLGAWQDQDGLLTEPATGVVNFGFNGVAALALEACGAASLSGTVVDALLRRKGVRVPEHPSVKQNPTLQAWSWMDGTFSWVEPTAWCLLAVKRSAARSTAAARARVEEAERLLADRVSPAGGWNYGNGLVYGKDLPAHVPATAAGVMAMQDLKEMSIVRGAIAFLAAHATGEGSSAALALGWMALRVVGVSDIGLDDALAARAALAEEFGNVANAAMLLHALDSLAAGQPPGAFVLG